jgi:hypothetical protein
MNSKIIQFCWLRFLILGTDDTVAFLRLCGVWMADGTFKTSPELFEQIYTVHGSHEGFTIPCLYGLLPNKTKAMYRKFWRAVYDLTGQSPETVLLTDFEQASYLAAIIEAGGDEFFEHGGCFFLFRQAVHKALQGFGLQNKYINDASFRDRVARLAALSFLPPMDVPGAFDKLAEMFTDDEQPLTKYFSNTWVGAKHKKGSGRKTPVFSPNVWSCHDRVLRGNMLTTNSAELFHKNHKAAFPAGCHPSMPTFIKNLHCQQLLSMNDIAKVAMGDKKKDKPAMILRTQRVQTKLDEYQERKNSGNLTTDLFLKDVALILQACVY